MKMSKLIVGALGLVAVIATGAPATSQAKETLVYANYVSEIYTTSQGDIWFMDEVEKRSNGEIVFERYFSSSLLNGPDLYPGLSRGAADVVAGVPSAYNRNDYPLSNVTLPFITNDSDAVTGAFTELFYTNDALRKEYESRNARVLYARGYSVNTIYSRLPITKAEDYNGLKIRAVLSIADTMKALGATPVSVPYPEALEGMARGVVDAMTASPFDSSVKGGLAEASKYGSDGGRMGVYAVNIVAINLDRWNKLSPEHQKILTDVSQEMIVHYNKMRQDEVRQNALQLCEIAAKEGAVKIHLFDDAEAAKVRDLAYDKIKDGWIEWASKTANVDASKVLDDYIALIRKHEATSTYKNGWEIYQEECGS
tara:strand:+ start:2253 stop:3356 length:1104 start_codon:yes stop_codon:yes gene_type:complete